MTVVVSAAPVDRRQPWMGLASYRESDSALFFGREQEALDLLRLVRRDVLTVLFGPSGTGKTSLINAGLFPRLRESGFLPVAIRLDHSTDRPDYVGQVRALIVRAVHATEPRPLEEEALAPPQVAEETETLWEYLHRVVFWDWRNNPAIPVMVFDQFEEIFTLGRNRTAVESFLSALADLAENYLPAAVRSRVEARGERLPFPHDRATCKIVLSLREDFVWRLDGLRTAMPSVMHNRLAISRMNGEQAVLAVRGPGRDVVEEPVAAAIVRFVAAANLSRAVPGEDVSLNRLQVDPALLSVVCRELNTRRIEQERPLITEDLLEQSGTNILSDFYENSFADLNPPIRAFVEDRLLTTSGFRSTVPLEEAMQAGMISGDIDALVDRRLIRIEERLGIPHLELSHDLLTRVAQKSRADRQEREQRERERRQRETEARERTEREKRKQDELRRTLTFVTAAALICLVFAVSALVFYFKADAARKDAVLERTRVSQLLADVIKARTSEAAANATATRAEAIAVATTDTANETASRNRQLQYVSRVGQAFRASEQGEYALARDALRAYIPVAASAGQDDRRTFPWSYVWRFTPSEPLALAQRGQVRQVAFSRDGRVLAARGMAGVTLWAMTAGKDPVRTDTGIADADALALSPDGRMLAVGGRNGLKLWTINPPAELPPLEGDLSNVRAVTFSPDGSIVAAGGRLTLWNVQSRKLLALEGPPLEIPSFAPSGGALAFSPDGSKLAACAQDGVRLVDMAGLRPGAPLEAPSGAFQCSSVAFSKDGHLAASGSGSIVLWDTTTGKILDTLQGHHGLVLSVAFSPDDRLLATSSADGTVKLWDAGKRTELTTLDAKKAYVFSVAFAPDGATLATAHAVDTLLLWDVRRWRDQFPLKGHGSGVSAVAFSSDGKTLVSGSVDKTVKIWDPQSRQDLATITGHSDYVFSVAVSPDGHTMATGGGKFAKLWDAQSGKPLGALQRADPKAQLYDVKSVAFSPDGALLAVADSHAVTLWNPQTRRQLDPLPGKQTGADAVAFSRDGIILAADTRPIRLWDVRSRTERPGPPDTFAQSPAALAISPDGRILAVGTLSHTIELWDLVTNRGIGELKGHSNYIGAVTFSPDGKTLASGGADETIKLWDTSSWQEVLTLKASSWVKSLAFSPQGNILASAGSAWDVGLWYGVSEAEVRKTTSAQSR